MATQAPQWVNWIIAAGIAGAGLVCFAAMKRGARENVSGHIGFTTLPPAPPPAAATASAAESAEASAEAVLREMQTALDAARVGATVGGQGVYLSVRMDRCSERGLRRAVGEPRVLELLLAHGYRIASCVNGEGELTETRLPPRGIAVPPSIEWNRSFVATPARDGIGNPADHPLVWCTGMDGDAYCFRQEAACVARQTDLSSLGAVRCHQRRNLVCYDTQGTERMCFLEQGFCEEHRFRGRAPCELRWAI